MKPIKFSWLILITILVLQACNMPVLQGSADEQDIPAVTTREPVSGPADVPPGNRIQPEDLTYLGAFRLPDESGGSNWDYSGQGLTYYPGGDPQGADDGFPGSLYGFGHAHHLLISEINIPIPVVSQNLDDLNTAETLQPFTDITDGLFDPGAVDIPKADLEYLPPQGDQTTGKLHFVWGQHFHLFDPSHGWSELDLSDPEAVGLWVFDGFTNYATSDYLFEIPESWANAYTPGLRLATGRFREGVWSGFGPALFAFGPWEDGSPPSANSTLSAITPLLLYGIQEEANPEIITDSSMMMNGYQESDHWWGGAWLTAGDSTAVVFVGTKAMGSSWYGFANGVVWPYDCADHTPSTCPEVPPEPYADRGFWAEDYQAQIIFYDPNQLAAVAQGEIEPYEPQPYASLDLTSYLFDPSLDPAEYKRDLVGAAAFDREHGLLFIFERLADDYKSVIHVFQVATD
ncbi:MAG: hypothetical protein PVF83_04845 [Anaerolineales bacterium]|jgi:hypothetical protein